jgi:hypothetical protein
MGFWGGDHLFGYLLIFLGLRTRTIQRKTTRKTIKGILQRRTVSSRKLNPDNQRQPRRLVRDVYRSVYDRDLSPDSCKLEPYRSDSDHENENIGVRLNVMMKTSSSVGVLSWVYTLFIGIVLCVQPVYTSWYLLTKDTTNNTFYLSSLFFNLIPIVQYILSVVYFSTSHFDESYNNCYSCFPSLNVFVVLLFMGMLSVSVFSQLLVVGGFSLARVDGEFPGYDDYDNKILINVFLWVAWVYGKLAVYTNLTVFSLVFCKHCRVLSDYVKKLKKNCFEDVLTINNITQEVLGIRYDIEESIDAFRNIFSSFTLLGAIGFGFFLEQVKEGNFDFFPWHQFVVYIVIQVVFFIIIFRVSKTKENLSDYIRQPFFIKKFLKRYNPTETRDKFDNNTIIVILNIEEENASTLDWIILNDIFGEDWTEFKVMGIDMSDGSLIKKGFVMVALIVGINSFVNG